MSFIGGMFGGVVASMIAAKSSNVQPQPAQILREGAESLYYNAEIDPNQRVFGVPGASLYHANLDDANAINAGIQGEQKVAAELERLASLYPNTYVFHSMKLPGEVGDIDHIVVQGNTALLVDSKNWKRAASYNLAEMTDSGDIVLRDGYEFVGGEIHLRRQMIDWQMHFISSDVNVHATLVLANRESETIQSIETGYSFSNLNGLGAVFSSVFSELEVPQLNPEMLRYYANMVQDPEFDKQDVNNYVEFRNAASYYVAPVDPPATTLSKWLVVWSVLNYVLLPILFPIAGLSAIPLLIITHRHKSTIKARNLGGGGRLTAVLIFSYLLFTVWAVCTALVAAYYLVLPNMIVTP